MFLWFYHIGVEISDVDRLHGPYFVLLCVDPKSIRNPSPTFFFFFKSGSLKIFFPPHTFIEVSVTIVPRQSLRQRYERLNFSLACALFDPHSAGFGGVMPKE